MWPEIVTSTIENVSGEKREIGGGNDEEYDDQERDIRPEAWSWGYASNKCAGWRWCHRSVP